MPYFSFEPLFVAFYRYIDNWREARTISRFPEGLRNALLLRRAAASGNRRRLEKLLRRAGPCKVSAVWAVMMAAQAGDATALQALQALLDAGAPPEQPCGTRQETPLHFAASSGNFACTLALLRRGVEPAPKDVNGDTPLHRAATQGRAEVLWLLLHVGGAKAGARGRRLQTPLHRVAAHLHPRCVEELLRAGADVAATDLAGATPLHAAAAGPSGPRSRAVIRMLLAHGADVDAYDNDGLRPVHYAAQAGCYKNVRLLAGGGADVNARARDGCTALHTAATGHSERCVEELALCGAQLDAPNRHGFTPLHLATAYGRAQIVRELLRLGARADVRAMHRIMPLEIARARGDDCERALVQAETDGTAHIPISHFFQQNSGPIYCGRSLVI